MLDRRAQAWSEETGKHQTGKNEKSPFLPVDPKFHIGVAAVAVSVNEHLNEFTSFHHHLMDGLSNEFGYDTDSEWKDADPKNNPPATVGDISSSSMTDTSKRCHRCIKPPTHHEQYNDFVSGFVLGIGVSMKTKTYWYRKLRTA